LGAVKDRGPQAVRKISLAKAVVRLCIIRMIKRALPFLAAFFAVGFSLSAQERETSDRAGLVDFTLPQATSSDLVEGPVTLERTGSFRVLNNAWYGRGPLTLVDGRLFSFPSAFGWVEGTPGDFLPDFTAEELPRVTPVGTLPRESGAKPFDLFRKPDYAGGEVGFFYGKSIGGKHSREVEAGYILGEIIQGNTHIGVGVSYEHSTGNRPLLIGH
jgi:hypothetical protein